MNSEPNANFDDIQDSEIHQEKKETHSEKVNKKGFPVFLIILSVLLAILTSFMVVQSVFYFSLSNQLAENEAVVKSTTERIESLRQTLAPQADFICNSLTEFNPEEAAKSDDTTGLDKINNLYGKIDTVKENGEELHQCLCSCKEISSNARSYAIKQLTSDSNNDESNCSYYDMETITDQYISHTDTLIKRYNSEKDYLLKRDDPRLSDEERIGLELDHDLDSAEYDMIQDTKDDISGEIKTGEFFLTVGNDEDFEKDLLKELNVCNNTRNVFLAATIFVSFCLITCILFAIIKIIKRHHKNKLSVRKNNDNSPKIK